VREYLLNDKSIAFAVRIIKLHDYLIKTKKETIVSKQIVRSGTSIGADVNEASYGQSKADFVSKMHIALKETAETEYWLKLLTMSEYISEEMGKSLLSDCLEIKRILIASINTAKENMQG
jgi:four helix bundle protein